MDNMRIMLLIAIRRDVAVKANIDQLLGSTEHEKNKADRPQQQDECVRE